MMTTHRKIFLTIFCIILLIGASTWLFQNQESNQHLPQERIELPVVLGSENQKEAVNEVLSVTDNTSAIITQQEPENTSVLTHEVVLEAIVASDIPEVNMASLHGESGLMTVKEARYFRADFSSFLDVKPGDEVSLDLDGIVYSGIVNEQSEIQYLADGPGDLDGNDDGSISPEDKVIFIRVDGADGHAIMDFTISYFPHEGTQIRIGSGQIRDHRYQTHFYFDLADGYGSYLTHEQFRRNWGKLGIGNLH